jgi:glycosyltransferase involved in cell wall biosynthesis
VKTLRIIARLNIGGPARHAVILDEGLRCRGTDTLLVYGQLEPGESGLDDEAAVRRLRAIRLPDLGRRIRPWSDLRALGRLLRIVFAERPDVVHTHTAKAGTLGRLAAFAFNATRRRGRRCLVVHTVHGNVLSGYFGPAGSLAVRLAERLLARVTDCIITLSPRQREEIVTRFRVAPASRVRVVPLGLELDGLLALPPCGGGGLRAALGLAPDDIVFGYIGRFVPIKNLPALLEALAIALARAPSIRLVLVGDGPLRSELHQRVATLGVEHAVRFVGWQRDLPAVYATVDAVVLSSSNEGTPLALIEAMAAGRPVIATEVGGVADVVADAETGLLVPPGDSRRLADALVLLAGDAATRQRLASAGRQAADRYRSERLVDDIMAIYDSGLATKRRAKGEMA